MKQVFKGLTISAITVLVTMLFLFVISMSGCQQQVVCNTPYILVGTSCCLDQNNNSICDADDEKQEITSALKKIAEVEEKKEIVEIKPEETTVKVNETKEPVDEELLEEAVIGKDFVPVLSEEEGYAVRLLDYKYTIISLDKAKITEMKVEIINNDPNNLWPSVNIYTYADNDPLEMRTFAEENIAPNYYIPSGYKTTRTFPVSITIWNYKEDKNIKLSLYDSFDFSRRALASSTIKVNLAGGKIVEDNNDDLLPGWQKEDEKLKVSIKEIKCEHVIPSYYLKSFKIELTNKAFDNFIPVIEVKLTDREKIRFEDTDLPLIKKGTTKDINLTINTALVRPKSKQSMMVTVKNPAEPDYKFILSNSFDVAAFLE